MRRQQLVPLHDLVALVHGHVVAHVQRVQQTLGAPGACKAREAHVGVGVPRVHEALAEQAEPREHVGLVALDHLVACDLARCHNKHAR